jgi:hypothetical protein
VKIHMKNNINPRWFYGTPLERKLESRVNVSGFYEQWGSETNNMLGASARGENDGDAPQIMPSVL